MTVRYAKWQPGSVLARCAGYGASAGALIGFIVLLTLYCLAFAESGAAGLAAALEFTPPALVIALGSGAVIGLACGLVAFFPLLVAGQCDRSLRTSQAGPRILRTRPVRASLCAGGGAVLLPAVLAALTWIWHEQWFAVPLFLIGTLALCGGLALGPRVMYGPAGKWLARGLDCAGE